MKKLLLGLSSLIFISITLFLVVLFFKPTWIIGAREVNFILTKSKILKSWSWNEASVTHEYIHWNERSLKGQLTDLVVEYESESLDVATDFKVISWDLILKWTWEQGLHFETRAPFYVRGKSLAVVTRPTAPTENSDAPPDVWELWQTLWGGLIPDLDIDLQKISIQSNEKEAPFELALVARKVGNQLTASAFDVTLSATPDELRLKGPPNFKIPTDLNLERPLLITESEVIVPITEDEVKVQARVVLNEIELKASTEIELPLEDPLASKAFIKKVLLPLKAQLQLTQVKRQLMKSLGPPIDMLPAPFNVLEGSLDMNLSVKEGADLDHLIFISPLDINLKGASQIVDVRLLPELALNLNGYTPETLNLEIKINRLSLLVPRLSKTSLPPQFIPDSRIKSVKDIKAATESGKKLNLNFDLKAQGKNILSIKSNLLDEPLRLNLDLAIRDGILDHGTVKVLELNTSVFKRPISVKSATVRFQAPLEPTLKAKIDFKLPQYLVTLELEGPMSSPRTFFSSKPPLPEEDIYSVLLFGRPMTDLGDDDQQAAAKTRQLASQGILSLSVLYFFAGTPIESVGYDPGSNEVSTQIGLSSKSSLRIGAGNNGLSSAGVRRALGKGWYLDTSVQKTQATSPTASESGQDYGVLLERIISY